MEFELTEEEVLLQETVADLGRAAFGGIGAPEAASADWQAPWEKLAGMGLTGLLVPEDLGGSGGTLLDACLVAEALARADAWVPYVGSSILAASALLRDRAGNAEHLAALASGTPYALAVDDRLSVGTPTATHLFDWRPGAIATSSSGQVLDRGEVIASGIDPLHPLGRLPQPVEVAPGAVDPGTDRATAASLVGLSAWLTGVAQAALDEAVAYARIRSQFGAPIGSFQAVQHLCAHMYFDLETSRSVTYGAAWSVDHEDPVVHGRLARAARAWTARAAVRVCETSVQVLGGIGVTFEHRAHLRLRTAHQFGRVLGTAADLERQAGWSRFERGSTDGSR